ncbi:AAA family ATPase [Acidihalobacter prosperus]|uniref:Rad50/SbcC-type AAA domain-containing protein n=1 Tax=Acidihalobacter prosperus TaxID=160660 RepID=A0A1A6C103_9GAMM|nr:AAA family ATPase [Acidihalobacter prosperus]OBS08229.1 hypothetical protein Thpro_022479 [Acidihalobacter prosperus]
MTSPSLVNLRVENLRGAVSPFILDFEKGRKLTIVYGENGTGKSTISDALDLLGNGNVGSLDRRGVGGTTRTYWPSVGKAHTDVKVVLETSAGTCTLSLGKKTAVVDNEQFKPQVDVLRRSQVLSLIAAQPAERYKEISKFVDVSGVEASETALRRLIDNKQSEYETATTRLGANKEAIENFWAQAGCPAPDAFTWAQSEIQKDQKELDLRKAAIDGLLSCWDKVASHPDKLERLNEQVELAKTALRVSKEKFNEITSDATDDYLEVLGILKAAQLHFAQHPHPEVCPLCESAEKAEGLVEEVNRRIQAQGLHSKLDTAKEAVANAERTVQMSTQRLEDFRGDASSDFESLENYCADTKAIFDLDIPSFPIPSGDDQWKDWLDAHKAKREGWKQAADACVDSKNFIETLRRSLNDYKESETVAKDLVAVLPRLREVLAIVERERKQYTDEILAVISTRVGELYEKIHPGEGLKKIVLALNAARRGSLDIATEFAGKAGTPPQAYFSDSHLDTLGLCVFLALAERENPETKILVLDDVLGSVDEPHVERVIGLIYDISQQFQHAIVTTHYRPWREKFRWGILKPDQVCQFVELRHWSFGDGITLTGSTPEITRLKALLATPDPDVQAITGKAGVILEAILDFLTLKYGCAVPRNPRNAYVLSDLLNAVNGKLLNALSVESVGEDDNGDQVIIPFPIRPILDELKAIAQARNVLGAHFNALSFELYPEDGIRFARLVEQLSDALICPDHGWPTKDTGSYWKNGGDTRRLHPLRKPS